MAAEAAEELGLDDRERAKWRELLGKLPPIPTNAQGVWTEFSDKAGLWHQWDWARFMTVFPMELVSAHHGPSELREQAHKSIEELYAFRKDITREDPFIGVHGGFAGAMLAVALIRMG